MANAALFRVMPMIEAVLSALRVEQEEALTSLLPGPMTKRDRDEAFGPKEGSRTEPESGPVGSAAASITDNNPSLSIPAGAVVNVLPRLWPGIIIASISFLAV